MSMSPSPNTKMIRVHAAAHVFEVDVEQRFLREWVM